MNKILIYGDSNTWGFIPGTAERYSTEIRWPKIVQKELGQDFEIIENGISGRTTCFDIGWGECKNGKEGLGFALLSTYPLDGVVVMLGSNDILLRDAAKAKAGLDDLVRIIKNANHYYRCYPNIFLKEPKILIVAPPLFHKNVDNSPIEYAHGKFDEAVKFVKYCQDVAKSYNVDFLDGSKYAQASEIDSVHLTANSHLELGKQVALKLKEMFR